MHVSTVSVVEGKVSVNEELGLYLFSRGWSSNTLSLVVNEI